MNILIPIGYDYGFIVALMNKLIQDIQLKLLHSRFNEIDAWLNTEFDFPELVYSKNIILFALKEIEIVKLSSHFSIQINKNVKYKGTNIKLITLLKMISYGNRTHKGNPIFIDEFKKLNIELNRLYIIYNRYGVV